MRQHGTVLLICRDPKVCALGALYKNPSSGKTEVIAEKGMLVLQGGLAHVFWPNGIDPKGDLVLVRVSPNSAQAIILKLRASGISLDIFSAEEEIQRLYRENTRLQREVLPEDEIVAAIESQLHTWCQRFGVLHPLTRQPYPENGGVRDWKKDVKMAALLEHFGYMPSAGRASGGAEHAEHAE